MGFLEAVGILALTILAFAVPRGTVAVLILALCVNSHMISSPPRCPIGVGEQFFVAIMIVLAIVGYIIDVIEIYEIWLWF